MHSDKNSADFDPQAWLERKKIADTTIHPSKETPPQTDGFIGSADLHTHHGEDMKPIAIKPSQDSYLLAVADGFGGSGAIKRETPEGALSEAQIATRSLGSQLLHVALEQPDIFLKTKEEEVNQALIESVIKPTFDNLVKSMPPRLSLLKGSVVKNSFATTLTVGAIRLLPPNKRGFSHLIRLFTAGDSPYFVITPDRLYTNYSPGFGDDKITALSSANQTLESKSILVPENMPFAVLLATDFIVKMGDQPLEQAKKFIKDALIYSKDPASFNKKLQERYDEHYGNLVGDDATMAVFTQGNLVTPSHLN